MLKGCLECLKNYQDRLVCQQCLLNSMCENNQFMVVNEEVKEDNKMPTNFTHFSMRDGKVEKVQNSSQNYRKSNRFSTKIINRASMNIQLG